MNEEKYNLFNPHPAETYKYSYRDMLDCWIAARENLVRWGIGDGDKPDFSSWIKQFYDDKQSNKINESIEKIKEEIEEKMNKCPQCEQDAYDGYICHNCGMKKI